MNKPKIPISIIILAIFFLITGSNSFYKIIRSLFSGVISLDYSFFLFFVAIGLFNGKDSSRKWAIFHLYLLMVLITLFWINFFIVAFGTDGVVTFRGAQIEGLNKTLLSVGAVFLGIIVPYLLSFFFIRKLKTSKTKEFFGTIINKPWTCECGNENSYDHIVCWKCGDSPNHSD